MDLLGRIFFVLDIETDELDVAQQLNAVERSLRDLILLVGLHFRVHSFSALLPDKRKHFVSIVRLTLHLKIGDLTFASPFDDVKWIGKPYLRIQRWSWRNRNDRLGLRFHFPRVMPVEK